MGVVNQPRMCFMAELLATSLDREVQMIDRSVLTVNEAAVRDGRVGRLCGELSHLHYLNCIFVGLDMIAL